ncbi:MAG: cytochrome c3 family protein [Methylacidiphilales bacterium]|nr:cytochrome c3 family protein [Candidatus Methylacidiphilales bacterium]
MMHVWRPLFVVIALVAGIFIARTLWITKDFGVHEQGYVYGWYRQSNVTEWETIAVKYQGRELCADCHSAETEKLATASHKDIQCENCHGPAFDHPSEPPKPEIDRSRNLCLRCHTRLDYPTSQRSQIKGIIPDQHNPGLECAACHDPHEASKP